ncbi:hypothetical protein FKM82_024568 [Ascaphus truei]
MTSGSSRIVSVSVSAALGVTTAMGLLRASGRTSARRRMVSGLVCSLLMPLGWFAGRCIATDVTPISSSEEITIGSSAGESPGSSAIQPVGIGTKCSRSGTSTAVALFSVASSLS